MKELITLTIEVVQSVKDLITKYLLVVCLSVWLEPCIWCIAHDIIALILLLSTPTVKSRLHNKRYKNKIYLEFSKKKSDNTTLRE